MRSVVRVFAAAGLAVIGLSCADQSVSGLRARLALLPINPAFSTAPDGGPDIEIATIRGVLKNANGTDSAVAEAIVEGDSAILEFLRVTVNGDSTPYQLGVQAFDENDEIIFEGNETIQVKPGENPPASPTLAYVAADTAARSLEIRIGAASATVANLRWQGAIAGNTSCINRAAEVNPTTEVQLSVVGKSQAGADVNDVRVGWRSLDPAVATVDDNGLVVSRCANKSTSVIARTFTDHADTITINVTAPPFTLRMSPEAATVQRGATQQFDARLIDELGNESSASGVTWASSDPTKATVSPTGEVTAIRNGRVQIIATSGDRATVGIVEVVRPSAASVRVIPAKDTAAINSVRQFVAVAFDAAGRVIADAVEFTWSSLSPAVATIDPVKGRVTTQDVEDQNALLTAMLDGKADTAELHVLNALPPGTLKGIVNDGETGERVSGAMVSIDGGPSALTDATGLFELNGVSQGDTLTLSKTGYVTIKFLNAPAFPNQTIFIHDIPLPQDVSSSTGNITGKVVNALNGQGVGGVTVRVYKELNAAPQDGIGNPLASTTTASNGVYGLNLLPGAYTFVAGGTGYSQSVGIGIVQGGQPSAAPDIILPPNAPNSGVYAIVTWGPPGTNVPGNLDLHITGPDSPTDETSRFQVHSGNRSFVISTDTVSIIDILDSTAPGAEVGSVRAGGIPGVYRFYVKNVGGSAGSKALADSAHARVDVFQNNRLVGTFLPPAGSVGTVWEVFKFDGARVTPVGVISNPADPNILPNK